MLAVGSPMPFTIAYLTSQHRAYTPFELHASHFGKYWSIASTLAIIIHRYSEGV
jgi:hypothetical protein